MNVLITGGNGFLGSNVSRRFLKDDHRVAILSNNSNNIQDILNRVDLYHWTEDFQSDVIKFDPDLVIHCAWAGGNNYLDANTTQQFDDNIPKGIRLVECLKSVNKRTAFVGFGSFAEYGDIKQPAKEDDQEQPVNLYGLSKYAFKMYSKMVCEQNSIHWSWIRPCYVFGKGDVDSRLMPRLIKRFLNNEDIELNSCKSVVDYIHIDDFSEMVYQLAIGNRAGVYNICSGQQYPVKLLVDLLRQTLNSRSKVTYNEKLDRGTPAYVCGDNSKVLRAVDSHYIPDMVRDILKSV